MWSLCFKRDLQACGTWQSSPRLARDCTLSVDAPTCPLARYQTAFIFLSSDVLYGRSLISPKAGRKRAASVQGQDLLVKRRYFKTPPPPSLKKVTSLIWFVFSNQHRLDLPSGVCTVQLLLQLLRSRSRGYVWSGGICRILIPKESGVSHIVLL